MNTDLPPSQIQAIIDKHASAATRMIVRDKVDTFLAIEQAVRSALLDYGAALMLLTMK